MSNQNNKRRPFKWYTDGDKVIKVFEGDSIPVSFYPGRKKKQSSESLQQTTISEQQSQNNINNQEINLQAFPELSQLSESEKKLFLDIIKEYQSNGQSKTFDDLRYQDYAEIPVDIDTFVDDDRYLGYAWKDSEGKSKLYPYWRKRLRELFPDNITTSVNNAIFSGARGLGKSEIAILIAAYLMYRVLCLKNPIEYFHLKPTEKLCFAFMNIKISLAEEIGNSKFQNTVKMSPWFMSHGTLVGRTNKLWTPPDCIQIIIGSQASDVIGLPIYFCLDGKTQILTSKGTFNIEDLVDKQIQVPTVDNNNQIVLSDICTVKETAKSDIEYVIELEDNTVIRCTPNHRFRLVDGTYKEAQYLTEDDDILSFTPYGYIYKTTNMINNKIYIGQHQGSYLDDKYIGSGQLLSRAIKKYGRNNFKCELLELCKDKTDLDLKEKEYIKIYCSQDPTVGYNIADGGQGGDQGQEVRQRISNSLKGVPKSLSHREKLSKAATGKHLTDECKQRISEGNKGKVISEATREKMSNSAKRLDHSTYKTNKGKIAITNGHDTRYINKDESLPENYTYGNCKTSGKHNMEKYYNNLEAQKLKSEAHKGVKNHMYGKGYLRQGGNNTNSHIRYFYKDKTFECRKDLVEYLKENIDSTISINLIRNIEANTYKKRTETKYSELIEDLRWERK